jgi:hypothetical protein
MLIRFSTLANDPDSGRPCRLLVVAHTLRDEGDLSADEHEALRTALLWFNEHVPIPTALADPEHRRAISWFKPAAVEALQRMWQLKGLLDAHGHDIDVLRTADPGAVLYQDDLQVIAKPRKGQRF